MILTGISINQTALDWNGNLERILESLAYLKNNVNKNEPNIVLYPELVLSGYGCEDGFLLSTSKNKSWQCLQKILEFSKKIKNSLIVLGTPFYYKERIFNTMAIIYNGNLLAIIPKSYLAGEGIHYEQRWFTAYKNKWKKIKYLAENKEYEFYFGQGIIEFLNIRILVEICEDSWVNHRPSLYFDDIDIILNPSASHFAFGKYKIRKDIAISTSFYHHCYYFSVNLLGNEAGKAIYDGSKLLAKNGILLYENKRFSFKDILIRTFNLDFKDLKNKRKRIYSYRNDHKKNFNNLNKDLLYIPILEKEIKPYFEDKHSKEKIYFSFLIDYSHIHELKPIQYNNQNEFLEFLDVERLGLFDYLRKTNSKGYTISLSGGADSSLCAILVYQMIRKGIIELGLENFIKKINIVLSEEQLKILNQSSIEEQVQYFSYNLLHTIYQKTDQNSEKTKELAYLLSKELNTHHLEIEIQSLMDDILQKIENLFLEKISWDKYDLALQNIQSRIRSPIAWLVANITNSVLIATSNRSEASVGYTTMDGDTSGGLAPIAGIDKPFILKFLQFISEYEDEYTKSIKIAKDILKQPPSAELKPVNYKQTDEKDLMPYSILTMIERFAIEELLSPEEILEKILKYKEQSKNTIEYYHLCYYNDFIKEISKYNKEEIKEMINKFFRLWHSNQWKRERFATSFHIDSYNVDPRGWFRFPVLSKYISF